MNHQVAQTKPFKGSLERFRDQLVTRIEKFEDHFDPYGSYHPKASSACRRSLPVLS